MSHDSALVELLDHPIIQAPMAGGGSGPDLASAVSRAGGLGFLAAGYRSAAEMSAELRRVRELTDRPFGVNLFIPQTAAADPELVARYASRLKPETRRYGVELGAVDGPADDDYAAKVAALLADPVPVVSFHFGCPEPAVLQRFAGVGTRTVVTVTDVAEARSAYRAGAFAVCAQGVEAGGHQGSQVDRGDQVDRQELLPLVAQVAEAVPIPVIAAGGLMRGEQIAEVLAAGAVAAQLGTAFLATPESGAHPLHKQALTDERFEGTTLTRAFTGRPARGLINRFVRAYDQHAPSAYPQLHYLTSGLRKAAAAAGDLDGMALWAGRGHRMARMLPARQLVATLVTELNAAR